MSLPVIKWTDPVNPVASRGAINRVASRPQDTQLQVAAENAPLRIVYGRARIGAQVADVLTYQNNMVMLLVWCEGQIEQIESVSSGDQPMGGVDATPGVLRVRLMNPLGAGQVTGFRFTIGGNPVNDSEMNWGAVTSAAALADEIRVKCTEFAAVNFCYTVDNSAILMLTTKAVGELGKINVTGENVVIGKKTYKKAFLGAYQQGFCEVSGAKNEILPTQTGLHAGIRITHYHGTLSQNVDPTLKAAYASHGITYNDALSGIAYSVALIPLGSTSGFPTFSAIIKGRRLYDHRTGLTAYSDNPALALRDFITNSVYGLGRAVDEASVDAVANFCDQKCGNEKRRLIGLAVDNVQPGNQWLEALRTYAGCMISHEGAAMRLIPDTTTATSRSFGASQIMAGSFKLKKRGVQNVPTVMDVRYTDTSVEPWVEKSAIVKAAGVDAGTVPRRESQVSLPGITRYTQAYREATERLNKLALSDLYCEFVAFDEALKVQVGDVIEVTHPIGLTAKKMRVLDVKIVDAGRWQISANEYDPAVYSNKVVAAPTYLDTNLFNLAVPAAPTGLFAIDSMYTSAGVKKTRLEFSWDASEDLFFQDYLPEYQAPNAADKWTALPVSASPSVTVEDALQGEYTFRVRMRNAAGRISDYSEIYYYFVGGGVSTASAAIAAAGGNSQADVTIDALGNAVITFAAYNEPQILAYELREGASFEAGTFVATTTGTTFTLPVLGSAGKVYWIRAKYETGYSAAGYRIDFSGVNLAAPGRPTWSIAEPNLVYTWGAVAGAAQYLCLFEVGGVTTVKTVATPGASFPIPKYSAAIRIVAMAADGTLSPFVDEELSLSGQYKYNEIVNVALPLTTGKYVNLAFTAANTIKRASLLGNAPVAPYVENINDGDLYAFGYNLQNVSASSLQNVQANWFRHGFWREQTGYFESAVVDLGAVLTGSLMLSLTKTVTYVGDAPVSTFSHVSAEYMAEFTGQELIDKKAFLTARFFVATDSAFSASWKEAANGDWITARYVKIVVDVAMASPLTEITVTAGAITIDVPDVTEPGSTTGVTSAGKAITFTKSYHSVSCVIATARGAAKAYTGNITATGCTLYVDTGTQQVDYFVKGY